MAETLRLAVIWTETIYRFAQIEVPADHSLDDDEILSLAVAHADPEVKLAGRKLDGYEEA